jgi:ribosomal protein L37E
MKSEMTCERCGAAMNHQADKPREPTTREEANSARFGGILVAVFACPNCGWIASRVRQDDD